MKVWGFNCYGVCVAYIEESRIEEYNQKNPIASKKIVTWKSK